jgi:hypothetical protein
MFCNGFENVQRAKNSGLDEVTLVVFHGKNQRACGVANT